MKVALALYTLREYTAKNFAEVLEKAAKLGYEGVEFAGFGDVPADVMKGYLDQYGLAVTSCHMPLQQLEQGLDEAIRYNLAIGNRNIVCAWAPMGSEAEFQATVDALHSISKTLKEHGMQLYYHNHAHEIEFKHNGKPGLDCMYDDLFAVDELRPEVDVFWVWKAGACPVDYTKRYGNRTTLWHIKDGDVVDGEIQFAISGQGKVGIADVVKAAADTTIEWLIVENDNPQPEGYYVAGRSADYLHGLLGR